MSKREVYLEFRRVGSQIKVSAIDSVTGLEVSTFGPASVSQNELGQLAVRKLNMRLQQLEKEKK